MTALMELIMDHGIEWKKTSCKSLLCINWAQTGPTSRMLLILPYISISHITSHVMCEIGNIHPPQPSCDLFQVSWERMLGGDWKGIYMQSKLFRYGSSWKGDEQYNLLTPMRFNRRWNWVQEIFIHLLVKCNWRWILIKLEILPNFATYPYWCILKSKNVWIKQGAADSDAKVEEEVTDLINSSCFFLILASLVST